MHPRNCINDIGGVRILPIGPGLIDEWRALCDQLVIWSSRPASDVIKEATSGPASGRDCMFIRDNTFGRLAVEHVEVIPTLYRGEWQCDDIWIPTVYLITRYDQDYRITSFQALSDVSDIVLSFGPPPWPRGFVIEPIYVLGSHLPQHIGLAADQVNKRPSKRTDESCN